MIRLREDFGGEPEGEGLDSNSLREQLAGKLEPHEIERYLSRT